MPNSTAPGTVRLRLDISYDGTDFSGWAVQPGRRTVQGALGEALTSLFGTVQPRLVVAGRTDAGVHATGQVAHLDLPARATHRRTPAAILRGLNALLPADVRVRAVSPAPDGFDARFSALSRRYVYRVADGGWGVEPLRRFDTHRHRRPLDLDRMSAASIPLRGEHDFAAFCRARPEAGTVRRLIRLSWHRQADGVAVASVEADAFCHSMVRSLVGALLAVGDGRQPVPWPGLLLRARRRNPALTVAPARGLTLVAVRYPPAERLAGQAARARRRREQPTDALEQL